MSQNRNSPMHTQPRLWCRRSSRYDLYTAVQCVMIKGTTREKPNPTEALVKQWENSSLLLMLPATGSPTGYTLALHVDVTDQEIPVPPPKFASIRNALSRKQVIVIIIFKSGVCFPTTLPPNKQTFSLGNGSQCGPHPLTDALTPTASRTQAKHLHPTKLPLRHRGSPTPSF